MNVTQKIAALYGYYGRTRSVGHTDIWVKGAENSSGCLILAHSLDYAATLGRRCGQGQRAHQFRILSWANLRPESLAGKEMPLVIDNGAMLRLLDDVLGEIQRLKDENWQLRDQLARRGSKRESLK